MHIVTDNQLLPVHSLKPDDVAGNKNFRVYNFNGCLPDLADCLIPHRKDYHLLVFIRRANSTRQWIDMAPYVIQDNAVYFTGPNQIIVKEGLEQLWSTGIAFTNEFLSFQESASLSNLPIIRNLQSGHELYLNQADINFVEDILAKINDEYISPGEWQHRMLTAHLTVLLTYLSRLYTEQYKDISVDKLLLKKFQAKIDECYRELHEVKDYASLLHISAGYLSDVVKIQSGKPAIKHIHERIVLEARRLLFHTDNSLKEIAFDLGFSDASYFNRFFKRETGLTPAGYRANIREMYQ
jgi:AraC family transcriptional activator of pobA